jgi:NAD(P)-dependent dehydrogenase (short-subunit alcohol dehydrogenase family)
MTATLEGRRALITGASRGIGAAIARRLAAEGAQVVLVARTAEALAGVAGDIRGAGGAASTIAADLGIRLDLDRVIAEAGPLDIFVNNAAVAQRFYRFTEFDESYWRSVFEVGVSAPALLMRAFARGMAERGRGVVINISSMAGSIGLPFLAHYCAAKAAMDMVIRSMALELGRHGVRAVSIAPGAIDTGHHGVSNEKAADNPLGRVGDPEEVAALAAYLASDEAQFISGGVVACDGGALAGNFGAIRLFEPYLTSNTEP